MRQLATGFILVLWFSVFSGSAGYAQGKKPCDFITKSVLGQGGGTNQASSYATSLGISRVETATCENEESHL